MWPTSPIPVVKPRSVQLPDAGVASAPIRASRPAEGSTLPAACRRSAVVGSRLLPRGQAQSHSPGCTGAAAGHPLSTGGKRKTTGPPSALRPGPHRSLLSPWQAAGYPETGLARSRTSTEYIVPVQAQSLARAASLRPSVSKPVLNPFQHGLSLLFASSSGKSPPRTPGHRASATIVQTRFPPRGVSGVEILGSLPQASQVSLLPPRGVCTAHWPSFAAEEGLLLLLGVLEACLALSQSRSGSCVGGAVGAEAVRSHRPATRA